MSDRDLDLCVFGATSFVGQLVCRRLVERIGTGGSDGDSGAGGGGDADPAGPEARPDLRWAIAGRDAAKLARVASDTGADVEQIVADAHDPAAMRRLAESTRVVVSTVGPYALHGSDLVAAAAVAGTDHCDLTGEPRWMRAMIDAHQDAAAASGARIVHACGFDSIPSDLGVWFTQAEAQRRFGAPCERIGMRLQGASGGVSGGTIASGLNALDEARGGDALAREVLDDPHALAPEGSRHGPAQPEVRRPRRDELSGRWVAPFVMATPNVRVVLRTHALLGHPWGERFAYDEAVLTGTGPIGLGAATGVTIGTGAAAALSSFGPTRWLVDRLVPSSGQGPAPEAQAAGWFDVRFFGRTAAGQRLETKVVGDRDPGYGSTSRMLTEAALALLDRGRDEVGGGFWTPASALDGVLVDRLVAHAGITFDVVDATA